MFGLFVRIIPLRSPSRLCGSRPDLRFYGVLVAEVNQATLASLWLQTIFQLSNVRGQVWRLHLRNHTLARGR